jgi:serine/threonine protein kinase
MSQHADAAEQQSVISYTKKFKEIKNPATGLSYILGEQLGHGSFGKVRRAICAQNMRCYAVKILHKRALMKQGAAAMVNREIECLRALSKSLTPCSNVVALVDLIDTKRLPKIYMVFELVVGSDLQHVIGELSQQHRQIPHQLIRHLARQLLDAIEFCHSNHVIHNDIKPANMVLSSSFALKLMDFGCSQLLSMYVPSDTVTTWGGSPAYQCPEQYSDTNEHGWSGFKSDIWAAGVTLYQLATSSLPWKVCDGRDIDMGTLRHDIQSSDIDYSRILDPDLVLVLQNMLNRDPVERMLSGELKLLPYFGIDDFDPVLCARQYSHTLKPKAL